MTIIEILIAALLIILIYQDFRHRNIHLLLFSALFILFVSHSLISGSLRDVLTNTLFNLCFLGIQFSFITVYYSLKNKKPTNIINRYIGLGDILFFILLCIAFSPVNYLLFNITVMLVIIPLFGIKNVIFKKTDKTVPLAGAISVFFVALMVIKITWRDFNLYDDTYILNIITGIND